MTATVDDVCRRLDRLEESVKCLAQLLAQSTNIGKLARAVGSGNMTGPAGSLGPVVGQKLIDNVMEAQEEKRERGARPS